MRRLYETKRLLPLCAEVVVIAAKPEKQLAWLMARNDLSDQQVSQPRHTPLILEISEGNISKSPY